jgi:hypothetical protein
VSFKTTTATETYIKMVEYHIQHGDSKNRA